MSMSENHFKEDKHNVEHAILKLELCLRELNENNLLSSDLLHLYKSFLVDSLESFRIVLDVCNDGLQEMDIGSE